ncbi:alkaline phosphatase [Paenibacillus sp. IHBB 10380]|uniref:alkaline phosphatase n=1 Tax=Paenibacillus sp. IHBB 10380 TaxID=1566358 RepID=UPI0005CFC449|nr:alkaline phosphatase [Paenibacillus sp. IHBB 10380]AJS59745.1 alkaline phosphatase [Paenibacillus sp. IHBB 10380]
MKGRKLFCGISSFMLLCSVFAGGSVSYGSNASAGDHAVKNVILFVTDGMSLNGVNLARWYQGGEPLFIDKYFTGLSRTYSADSLTTDSAAGATALATGHKIKSETVSILPDKITMPFIEPTKLNEANKPLPTILEAARLEGKGTGLVFTCELTDATPAVFASHAASREFAGSIAEQMVYDGVDVLLGGGSDYLVPGKKDNNRKDGEDLTKVLKTNGYEYVTNKNELLKSKTNKIWGLFQSEALDADFDLNPKEQPNLAEMTKVAIDKLATNENGFFMMVEASQIDWFGHDNDPIGMISEILAFDKAFKVAVEFAEKDGNTVVVSTSDHATGGLNMTNYDTMNDLRSALKGVKHTSYGIEGSINESNMKKVLKEEYGLTDLTKEEVAAVKVGLKDNLSPVIGHMIGERIGVSFSTEDHTTDEVGIFAYHPRNFKPTDFMGSGVIMNSDIGKYIQHVSGLDVPALEKTLYVSGAAFIAKGATVKIDYANKENPVIVVKKGNQTLKLPLDKNIALIDGKTIKLNTLTLLIGGKTWLSQEAVDLIK